MSRLYFSLSAFSSTIISSDRLHLLSPNIRRWLLIGCYSNGHYYRPFLSMLIGQSLVTRLSVIDLSILYFIFHILCFLCLFFLLLLLLLQLHRCREMRDQLFRKHSLAQSRRQIVEFLSQLANCCGVIACIVIHVSW